MNRPLTQHLLRACAGLALAAIVGCSSDSPTAPSQQPPGGGGGGAQPATTWRITVTATPDRIPARSTAPSLIVVDVRRADNNQPATDGLAVVLTTTLGEFGESGSGLREVAVRTSGGRAGVNFYGGATPGTATIAAQLENSIGTETVEVLAFVLTRIEPNSGRPEGGDIATIFGQGIEAPVRVEFGSIDTTADEIAVEVVSVASDRVVIRTPPFGDFPFYRVNEPLDVIVYTNVGEPGEDRDVLRSAFTYTSNFFIDRVEPREVLARGGETVTVFGQGFEAPVRVVFGNTAGEVISVTPTAIQVRMPEIDLGTAAEQQLDVEVTIRVGVSGQQTDTLENGITAIADPADIFYLSQVVPDEGREEGGQTVRILGGGFKAPMRVTFNGIVAPVTSVTPTELRVVTPAVDVPDGGELQVDVSATIDPNTSGARTDTLPGAFTYKAALSDTFYISSVDPDRGDPGGGETVDIFGGGFEAPVRVTFGGSPAQVVSVDRTRIRVLTPRITLGAGQTQTVSVSVTINYNEVGQESDSLANAYTYGFTSVLPPVILSVTPATGPNEGGTPVRIKGSNFESPVQVVFGFAEASEFNGVEANVVSVTSDEIVVTTPAAAGFGAQLANRLVDIRVRNIESGLTTVMADAFRYGVSVAINAIQPNNGPATGNTTVTIFGSGFDNPLQVSIGNVQQQVISVTGTQIIFKTSAVSVANCAASGSGPVTVQLLESPGLSASGPTFTYGVTDVVITGANPTSGPQTGNTAVTISGSGFDQPVVSFGDQNATITSSNPNQVVVRTPVFTVDFDEVECDDSPGDGQTGNRYVPTSVDVEVRNLTTGCDDSLENAFTVTPTDATCRNDDAPVTPQCSDGFDNDGDTFVDAADPQCSGPNDGSEAF